MSEKTAVDLDSLDTALKSVTEELTQELQKHTAEVEKYGKASTELTGRVDELSDSYKSLKDEMADIAQRQQGLEPSEEKAKSAGSQFIKSDAFKAISGGEKERVRFEVKNTAITSDLSALFADDTTTFPMQRPGVIPGDFKPLTIRQLIPAITVSTNAVNALREASVTNNAAEVEQGALKPESEIEFEQYNLPIQTVAHWMKVSNQLLADAPAIASYIDTRLRDGLAQRIDKQLLLGDGTTPNLSGLTDAGNFTAYTATSGDNLADAINRAKYALWATGNAPDTAIVNPADWSALELARETSGGAYLYGTPGTMAGRTPFGVAVVMSSNMPQGSFLIGNISGSATIYQRQGAMVDMGYVNEDFTRNLVTLRAEERLALGVDRPSGIYYGDITAS